MPDIGKIARRDEALKAVATGAMVVSQALISLADTTRRLGETLAEIGESLDRSDDAAPTPPMSPPAQPPGSVQRVSTGSGWPGDMNVPTPTPMTYGPPGVHG